MRPSPPTGLLFLTSRLIPEVPPLPPHITFDQAVKLRQHFAQGRPRGNGVITGTARQLVGALLPGGKE